MIITFTYCTNPKLLRIIKDHNTCVINTIEIKNTIDMTKPETGDFICYDTIIKLLKKYYISKRFRHVIYIVDTIDKNFISTFSKVCKELQLNFTTKNIFDPDDIIERNLYRYFDNIY